MKLTITIDESTLQQFETLRSERMELMKTMHERIPMYKGKPKKLEKDPVYKEASYNFVIKGIEANDIKDKIFDKVFEEWKTQSKNSKTK